MLRVLRRPVAGLAVAATVALLAGCGTPDQTVSAQASASAASASPGADLTGTKPSEPTTSPSTSAADDPTGSGAAGSTPPPGSPSAAPAPGQSGAEPAPSPQPSDGVLVTGDVPAPLRLTLDDLAALAQQTVDVTYEGATGPAHPSETGPLLVDVLDQAGLRTAHSTPEELLDLAVVILGATGQQAVLSFGEISPDYTDQPPILSLAENGVAISSGPLLVVPGDLHNGRYVPGVVELRVVTVS